VVDGAHPFAVKLRRWCYADEADSGSLGVGGADEELLAARVFDLLNRHFVDLEWGRRCQANHRDKPPEDSPECGTCRCTRGW
jgi:hypothetical protein